MSMTLTFLGTGTSQGIPMIGCDCAVCRSEDPRDRRTRTSVLLSWDGKNVLIDATPEVRIQCLANDVRRLDAVLITHAHADHVFGLDDMRRFTQMQREPLGVYAGAAHIEALERVFGYARADRSKGNPDLPHLVFHRVEGSIELLGREVRPLVFRHGAARSVGYRIGSLAYCTDLSDVEETMLEELRGLEVLVLGALRWKPHPAHLSIEAAVRVSERVGARETYFVHMSHAVSQREEERLPGNVHFAYDGLCVPITDAQGVSDGRM